ncbi:MAG: hypothetical protein K6D02_01860 [Lachnospiraceae bacterium]|nr:hypothetical protein [Lachnospiraceae bacterium]
MNEILDVIHKTIYQFFDVCSDDEETPISDKDKLLLEVNKAICNNLKALEQELKTEWISVSKPPKQDGEYLVTRHDRIEILSYASNLYQVNNYDFGDTKRAGWYSYDTDYGYFECDGVTAWCELPKPYRESEE